MRVVRWVPILSDTAKAADAPEPEEADAASWAMRRVAKFLIGGVARFIQ
jgi:hypothetical protein